MGRVLLTPAAESDVAHLVHYFFSQSAEVASRFYAAVEDGCKQLAESPELGESLSTSVEALADIRRWPVPGFRNHLVFYRQVPRGIDIVRILHAARDWQAILESSANA